MDDFFPKNKKTPRRAFAAQILRSIKRPAEQIKISPTTPARYITGKSPVAGVSAGAGAAVALGVALLCAVTTSTLAAVSFTLTVESDFWVRGGRGLCCGRGRIQRAAGSQQRDDDHKKGRTKKALHRENASLISAFYLYRKRCSNVPS